MNPLHNYYYMKFQDLFLFVEGATKCTGNYSQTHYGEVYLTTFVASVNKGKWYFEVEQGNQNIFYGPVMVGMGQQKVLY